MCLFCLRLQICTGFLDIRYFQKDVKLKYNSYVKVSLYVTFKLDCLKFFLQDEIYLSSAKKIAVR